MATKKQRRKMKKKNVRPYMIFTGPGHMERAVEHIQAQAKLERRK